MAQVLIERPRFGSRVRGYRRQRRAGQLGALEDRSAIEAMGRRLKGRDKCFSDRFGPLRKFLSSNVGRPWNLVFSEICRHARLDNVAQQHLRGHVFDFVVTNVVIINNVPCHAEGRFYGEPLRFSNWKQVYVCPRSGLLKRIPHKPRNGGCAVRICVSKNLQYHRLEGIWLEVRLCAVPDECAGCVDALFGKRVVTIPKRERVARYVFDV
jgi:hypothetical protein